MVNHPLKEEPEVEETTTGTGQGRGGSRPSTEMTHSDAQRRGRAREIEDDQNDCGTTRWGIRELHKKGKEAAPPRRRRPGLHLRSGGRGETETIPTGGHRENKKSEEREKEKERGRRGGKTEEELWLRE